MGCCNSSARNTSNQILICKTLRAIEHKQTKTLDLLIVSAKESINDQITEIRGIKLNCLGYAM